MLLIAVLFLLYARDNSAFKCPISISRRFGSTIKPEQMRSYSSLSTTNRSWNKSTVRWLQQHDAINREGFIKNIASAAIGFVSLLTCNPSTSLGIDTDIKTKSNYVTFVNDNLVSSNNNALQDNVFKNVNWKISKKIGLNMEQMADAINDGLIENEWFVTGIGRPEYFSDDFLFSDPQVSVVGYEAYCQGVRKLFDQDTARCEVICCSVTGSNEITVLWRNSGKIQLGEMLRIELIPYVVTTKLITDPNNGNLIVSQTDKFETDSLGLFLYQFSFLRPLVADKVAPGVNILKQKFDFRNCKIMQ